MAGKEGTRLSEFITKLIEQDQRQPLPQTPKLTAEIADDIKQRLASISQDLNNAQGSYAYRDVAYDLRALAERIEVNSSPNADDISRGISRFGNRTSAELKAHADKLEQFAKNLSRTD